MTATVAYTSSKSRPLAQVAQGIELKDQYGEAFDPAKILGGKECLVLFGYDGCSTCQKITKSVAALQQEMLKQGRKIPIVVISMQPEKDRLPGNSENYVNGYGGNGVIQFKGEAAPDEQYKAGKGKPQADRLLHILMAPNAAAAKKISENMELITDRNNPKNHSSFITHFKNGQPQRMYRSLPENSDALDADGPEIKAYAESVAATVNAHLSGIAETPKKEAAPEAPKANPPRPMEGSTLALNVGAPVAVGLAAIVLTGGFSLGGILSALALAGAASVITQWATGAGLFDPANVKQTPPKAAAPKPEATSFLTPLRDTPTPDKARAQTDAALRSGELAALQTGMGAAYGGALPSRKLNANGAALQ